MSSTEHNISSLNKLNNNKGSTLFPLLKYDRSRIYRNEQNHERLLFIKEQQTNYLSNDLNDFEQLLNSEYFSQSPGPGYYDPINSSNQKYFDTKKVKSYINME